MMALAQALNLWVDLSGVDPTQKSYTYGSYNIKKLHEIIQESLDLDVTEVTGKMIFSYIVSDYFGAKTFTVKELLTAKNSVGAYLDKSEQLLNYLKSDDVMEESDFFAEQVRSALNSYEMLNPKIEDILKESGISSSRAVLAILRRDALRSRNSLQINQFLDGMPEPANTMPVYGQYIYRWNNINSMLKVMQSSPSCITLNMITPKENPYGAYFVFAIKNGGRLFTFTDKEWAPHPLAEGMWRRPDKVLAARAGRNWFPYDLAGLSFDDEGKPFIEQSMHRFAVPYQSNILPVKQIKDLAPEQVIWIAMMFELIVEKFWNQGYQAPALSYTAETIQTPNALIAAENISTALAVRADALPSFKELTLADVHSNNIKEADVGKIDPINKNAWMEDRYASQVSESILNVVAAPTGQKLLTQTKANSSISTQEINGSFEVKAIDSTSFGTKEELERDRLFIARTNYAAAIGKLAEDEFEARKKEVFEFIQEKMTANLSNLEPVLFCDDVWIDTEHKSDFGSNGIHSISYKPSLKIRQFVCHTDLLDSQNLRYGLYTKMQLNPIVLGEKPYHGSALSCYYTGAKSSHLLQMFPETTEQLAFMCGLTIKDLPDVLQNWTRLTTYKGNHILTRIDPLSWALTDPWKEMHFVLNVFVSKRKMNQVKKDVKSSLRLKSDGTCC